jgi:hypothetical protein
VNQFQFFYVRGFSAPFYACGKCRGTVRDGGHRALPVLVLPSECDASRLTLAEAIAANLNREAAEFEAGRREAA